MEKKLTVRLGAQNYRCTVQQNGREWYVDEPVQAGGGDTAPDPFAHLLASLGSCSAITLKMYAQRKGWPVEDIAVELQWEHHEGAGGKQTIFNRDLRIGGALSEEQLLRLHQIVKACPISRILEGEVRIDTTIDHAK